MTDRVHETERLLLRRLDAADAPLLLDYLYRNRDFLRKWEPLRSPDYYSVDSLRVLIGNENITFENGTSLCLYIFNKGEDKIIGTVSLTNIIYGFFKSCFLGYKIDETEINCGKITEALTKLIEIAFTEYELHRIEANIMPSNSASRRVVEKLGFTEEGKSKKYLKINGEWQDHLHFVLLNEKAE